ncbi:neuromodulin [Hylaeus anthracinus]|uniref:neuromodulin n=1 Tax=Hylaeus volcanicus TaxID=313075 RepID=UPI0023B83138|nr:neuromodulin [Hylaeus volcanicus]XP_054010997.1 neuromodulin [Hylaeus anthracinus]
MVQDSDHEMTKASVAATKIQANFRGYRARKRLKELKKDGELQSPGVIEREQRRERLENAGSSTLKERNPSRESLEEKSATKIQARVRGFLTRKKQQVAHEAATRIQAGFRGFKARKLLKQSEQ